MVQSSTGFEMTFGNFMADFLRLYRSRSGPKESGEEVRLWLELLELLLLVSHGRTDLPALLSPSTDPAENEDCSASHLRLLERRKYWIWAREDMTLLTDQERGIYSSWDGICTKPGPDRKKRLPHQRTTLGRMSSLFFTISARIASFIDQGISETWAELAAQFMVQAALELCLTPQGAGEGRSPLTLAFAWGWIPSVFWKKYHESTNEGDTDPEVMINEMFQDEVGQERKEKQMWQETRLRYLSLFDVSHCNEPRESSLRTRLKTIAKVHPLHAFEEKVVVFLEEMWKFCRKPLLVQIEEGEVEGLTNHEFEEFKRSIFVAI
jgi:hypothetical protein